MRYLTARKRAEGKGAAHTGTEHHWYMQVSAVGLAFMIPVWMYIFGSTLGKPYEEVLETFSHPFPAILTGLVLFVGMRHFAKGAQMMIEDYARGSMKKGLIMLAISISYAVIAVGFYALAKIAL
ncbi:succinate dehydrogenase, hydrophobic membrane anchor protein [Gemmobacter lutimaris]|jgi:succinate dehydrogenase / fumarate reductase membrane anchor subunit|uniref:Succinate dehydrogenase hydrophobic membrane anchor subunit n=3 Tax=Gemmobacter TaxID=204456 RepID=A0A398BPP2_9RHOB|nr:MULTISPECIES: succinate dehydrogenase, hydrophobic membrane anchor protein [Gemmobacter]OJY31956.1 MAG: succinate dehydrogenase, hydrophobic membrane anchor protein [Rhodobacterales bacterium 65-51]PTX51041.1 succinate dehydrogenase subunit D [Gemmobacter caeni]RID92515.1 succinate dehydrogenase, hydrophobic membrane anchor protein [Gemmobacter lutimaris]TWJ01041.1 succinate dehydrogenase subunit D [Gemmobacter caeni]GHC18733.1 succinate dehydrogenase [Gemmobacter nanjingensis]